MLNNASGEQSIKCPFSKYRVTQSIESEKLTVYQKLTPAYRQKSARPSTTWSYKLSVLIMQRKNRQFLWEARLKPSLSLEKQVGLQDNSNSKKK